MSRPRFELSALCVCAVIIAVQQRHRDPYYEEGRENEDGLPLMEVSIILQLSVPKRASVKSCSKRKETVALVEKLIL